MSASPDLFEWTQLDAKKVANLLRWLMENCTGPQEAYAVLCVTIIEVNDIGHQGHEHDKPSIDVLIAEVGETMRSVKRPGESIQ